MRTKQIDKTVIEISKQEILDEAVKNFFEYTKDRDNHLEDIFKSVNDLWLTVNNLQEGNYLKIFTDNRAIKCLPEEVLRQVEEYFFDNEEENDEEENDEKILSFKKGIKNLLDRELEIVITDGGCEVLAKIPESEIPY
jgi:hypothetical protein